MKTDGSGLEMISPRYSRFINVDNGRVYFMEEIKGVRKFYSVDIDGSNEIQLK